MALAIWGVTEAKVMGGRTDIKRVGNPSSMGEHKRIRKISSKEGRCIDKRNIRSASTNVSSRRSKIERNGGRHRR